MRDAPYLLLLVLIFRSLDGLGEASTWSSRAFAFLFLSSWSLDWTENHQYDNGQEERFQGIGRAPVLSVAFGHTGKCKEVLYDMRCGAVRCFVHL